MKSRNLVAPRYIPSERKKVSPWNLADVNVVLGFAFEFERSLRPERLTHIRPAVQLSGTWMLTDVKGAASHLRAVISPSLVYENLTGVHWRGHTYPVAKSGAWPTVKSVNIYIYIVPKTSGCSSFCFKRMSESYRGPDTSYDEISEIGRAHV